MTLPSVITRWFEGLQPRERRILRIGLPVIGVLIMLGTFAGLLDARDAAMQRWQRASALEPRITQLITSGATTAEQASTSAALLSAARTEAGVTSLTVTDVAYDQVLEQIAAWEQAGGRIEQLQLRRTSDGRVSGEIRGQLAAP